MADKARAYGEAEIAERLKTLRGWTFTDGAIQRRYETDGWPITLMLVNALGFLAEAADHHPDLAVSYRRVVVRLSTHDAGGITDKDFNLAKRFDELALLPAGASETGGTPFVRPAPQA